MRLLRFARSGIRYSLYFLDYLSLSHFFIYLLLSLPLSSGCARIEIHGQLQFEFGFGFKIGPEFESGYEFD